MTILIIASDFEQDFNSQEVITTLSTAWQKVDLDVNVIGISTLDSQNYTTSLSEDIELIVVASPDLNQFQVITQLAQEQGVPVIGLTTAIPSDSISNFNAIFPVTPISIEKALAFTVQQIAQLFQLFNQKITTQPPTLSQAATSKVIVLNTDLVLHTAGDFKAIAEKITAQNALLILYGSHTRSSYETFFEELELNFAFIPENGGGFYIPKNLCPYPLKDVEQDETYFYQTLGASATLIHGIVDKLAKITQIPLTPITDSAQYSVTYSLQNPSANLDFFKTLLQQQGLDCIKTEAILWVGKAQLFPAVQQFLETIQAAFPPLLTYAIGLTERDKSILEIVNEPYLIKQADGWMPLQLHNLNLINKTGIEGVEVALEEILKEE